MRRLAKQWLMFAFLFHVGGTAFAGIVFTPHLSEYSKLPRGAYADHTFIYTSIREVYDRNGEIITLGNDSLPKSESVQAALVLFRYLWIGNLFENTSIPFLNQHDQIFRIIANAGWQQGSEGIGDLSRTFGQKAGGSGIGDLFILSGLYGMEYRWGPIKGNDLWSLTIKAPIGDYDQNALLNTGTNYWSYIPQYAHHMEFFGRLYVDFTFAYQFKGRNDSPAYGGLTPTKPADFRNAEINFAWKFSEKFFWDVGVSYRESVGPNRFEQLTLNFAEQPLPPTTGCQALMVPDAQCNALEGFFLDPQPGPYEDNGVHGTLITTGFYYVYRASSVFGLRAAIPVKGQGSQFDAVYDVYSGAPPDQGGVFTSSLPTVLQGVQEAAAVSATPFFEARFVYLFWAP